MANIYPRNYIVALILRVEIAYRFVCAVLGRYQMYRSVPNVAK